jgi:hypothetical protein
MALSVPRINSLFRALGLSYEALRYNRSKRGWHMVALLAEQLTPVERVAAEAILGDDPMRAAMNFLRARNVAKMPPFWRQRWNILYETKIETQSGGSKGGNGTVSSAQ